MLMEIAPESIRQGSLLKEQDPRSPKLMQALDLLNREYGRNTVYLAAAGIQQRWTTLFESRTPRYTTRWEEVPVVR
jgi:DNA polymerase V